MDKLEFIKRMSAVDIKCMLLDDCLINPNEITLFTQKKTCLLRLMKKNGIPQRISDGERSRYVKIVSYDEMGILSWRKDWECRGIYISDNIVALSEEDSTAFFLWYAFAFVQTSNWLYNSVLQVLTQRLGVDCVAELETWLADYIKKGHYKINVKRIVILPQVILALLSPWQKIVMFLKQLELKVWRKLRNKFLGIKAILHNKFTQDKYVDYLIRTNVIENKWTVVNKKKAGSSGCTMIKEQCGNNTFFVKGNELPLYEGLRNEIIAQRVLQQLSEECTWFLPMVDCDSSFRWIRYEYVTWELLSQYKEKHSFTRYELDILGEYLVKVLDNLCSMKLVHNDLRCENIFVRTKPDGTLDGFVLTDFGCSSIDGSFPWEKGNRWGKSLARGVCGKMRYDENIVDDAASALLVYLGVGGEKEDSFALQMKERIGRIFFVCE